MGVIHNLLRYSFTPAGYTVDIETRFRFQKEISKYLTQLCVYDENCQNKPIPSILYLTLQNIGYWVCQR